MNPRKAHDGLKLDPIKTRQNLVVQRSPVQFFTGHDLVATAVTRMDGAPAHSYPTAPNKSHLACETRSLLTSRQAVLLELTKGSTCQTSNPS